MMTGKELFEKMKKIEEEIRHLKKAYDYPLKEDFWPFAKDAIRIQIERKEKEFKNLSQMGVVK